MCCDGCVYRSNAYGHHTVHHTLAIDPTHAPILHPTSTKWAPNNLIGELHISDIHSVCTKSMANTAITAKTLSYHLTTQAMTFAIATIRALVYALHGMHLYMQKPTTQALMGSCRLLMHPLLCSRATNNLICLYCSVMARSSQYPSPPIFFCMRLGQGPNGNNVRILGVNIRVKIEYTKIAWDMCMYGSSSDQSQPAFSVLLKIYHCPLHALGFHTPSKLQELGLWQKDVRHACTRSVQTDGWGYCCYFQRQKWWKINYEVFIIYIPIKIRVNVQFRDVLNTVRGKVLLQRMFGQQNKKKNKKGYITHPTDFPVVFG